MGDVATVIPTTIRSHDQFSYRKLRSGATSGSYCLRFNAFTRSSMRLGQRRQRICDVSLTTAQINFRRRAGRMTREALRIQTHFFGVRERLCANVVNSRVRHTARNPGPLPERRETVVGIWLASSVKNDCRWFDVFVRFQKKRSTNGLRPLKNYGQVPGLPQLHAMPSLALDQADEILRLLLHTEVQDIGDALAGHVREIYDRAHHGGAVSRDLFEFFVLQISCALRNRDLACVTHGVGRRYSKLDAVAISARQGCAALIGRRRAAPNPQAAHELRHVGRVQLVHKKIRNDRLQKGRAAAVHLLCLGFELARSLGYEFIEQLRQGVGYAAHILNFESPSVSRQGRWQGIGQSLPLACTHVVIRPVLLMHVGRQVEIVLSGARHGSEVSRREV